MGILNTNETRNKPIFGSNISVYKEEEDFLTPLTPEAEISSDADVGIKIPITPNIRDDFASDADKDKVFLQDYFPNVDKHLVYDVEKDVAGSNPFSFVTPKLPDGRVDYWKLMSPTTLRGPGWDRLTDEQFEDRHQEYKALWEGQSPANQRLYQSKQIDSKRYLAKRDVQKPGITLPELKTNPDYYRVVENYMDKRWGMNLNTNDQEEIVDAFVEHRRDLDDYISIHAWKQYYWTSHTAEAEGLVASKEAADLWTKVGGAFQRDASGLDRLKAVGNHAWNFAAAPETAISAFFGRGANRTALRKGADALTEKENKKFARRLEKNKKYSDSEKQRLVRVHKDRLLNKGMANSEVQGKALRRGALTTASLNAMFDVGSDIATQNTNLITGTQDKYNYFSTGLFGAGGFFFGGGLGYAYQVAANKRYRNVLLGKKTTPWIMESIIGYKNAALKKAETFSPADAWKTFKELKLKDGTVKNASEELQKLLDANTKKFTSFYEKAKAGSPGRTTPKGQEIDYQDAAYRTFFWGDPENGLEGVMNILERYGIEYLGPRKGLKDKDGKAITDNYANWFADVVMKAPKEVRKEFQTMFRKTLGKEIEEFKNKATGKPISLNEAMLRDAAAIREAGKRLGLIGNNSRFLRKGAHRLGLPDEDAILKLADDVLEPVLPFLERIRKKGIVSAVGKETADAGIWTLRQLGWLTDKFIKGIVINPGTTYLNVRGWQMMSGLQTSAQLSQAALFYPRALFSKDAAVKKRYYTRARQIRQNQIYKAGRLLDPDSAADDAMSFMNFFPDVDKLMKWANGGIEVTDFPAYMGLIKKEESRSRLNPKRWVDGYFDLGQKIYGTKAVDIYTKSVEFMTNLDMLVRKKYGMGIDEFMEHPDAWKMVEDPAWARVTSAAVSQAQRNTFSMSYYVKNPKFWGGIVNVIESMRKVAILGTYGPFGQFFNGTIAFQLEHSGISAIQHTYRKYAKKKAASEKVKKPTTRGEAEAGRSDRDIGELTARGAVTWVGLIYMSRARMNDLEAGLSWDQQRQSDGSIKNIRYEYPFAQAAWIGQMGAHLWKDGNIPASLWADGAKAFGPEAFTRGATRRLGELKDMFEDIIFNGNKKTEGVILELLAGETANIIAGITRSAEPASLILESGLNDITVDNKIKHSKINNATRYITGFFDLLGRGDSSDVLDQTEKRDPTLSTRAPQPVTRVLGERDDQTSPARQVMASIGLPFFRAGYNSFFPEVSNRLNYYMGDALNDVAQEYLDRGYKKLSLKQRQTAFQKDILPLAKAQALRAFENSIDPADEMAHLYYKLSTRSSETKVSTVFKEVMRFQRFKNDRNKIVKNVYDLSPKQLKIFINEVDRYDLRKLRERNIDLGITENLDPSLPKKTVRSLNDFNMIRIFD